MTTLALANGYYELPKGKLVNLVTCLEMLKNPDLTELVWPEGYELVVVNPHDLAGYRKIFRAIGQDLMWFSRMIMADEELRAILSHPEVQSYQLQKNGQPIGLMELDFRSTPDCELKFFGLTSDQIGTGISKILMNHAIRKAWGKPISRLWVHTCHYDHPNAVRFYVKSGFKAYAHMIEVHDDARLTGHLPREVSSHIALIEN
jgi:GNAT superfamily N-acetyltransferase